ncbi:sensor domain CHASE1-containing protein [Marinobacter daqiaonensis]|uniref:Sensor domain CHASE1-containing protein n=1 Tax=Marinobacter daqiaonensis TaxID=650891 RepID=A0A1I6I9Z4_9GAMM|nr:CHASE domain-containing protein [Marinobacter daqiaonensis]SFR63200.1 sensor domain CHASE1-containing protein [Marinobacter daqiaonensis]
MDSEHSLTQYRHLPWLLPGLVLVAGLTITALVAPRSEAPVNHLARELSRSHHEQLARALSQQAEQTLSEAGALPGGSRDGFIFHAETFLEDHPEIAGLERLITVQHSQREMVERQLSEESGQFIQFGEWDGAYESAVAPPREDYLIVRQSVFHGDDPASNASLGLVATSVPHWRSALRKVREEHRQAATTLTRLSRNGGELSALRVFLPAGAGGEGLLSVVIEPQQWLEYQLAGLHDDRWRVEIHDISRFALRPMASLPSADEPDDVPATRSPVSFADRQWMLSTWPSGQWQSTLRQQAAWPAWLAGLTVTLLATGLTLWAGLLSQRLRRLLHRRTERARHLGRQLENTRVEKSILHHSLQESDRRTRDLIELGAGIFAELDESRRIGYLSPQAATLLDQPSAELADSPVDCLFPPDARTELAMAFDAARREQVTQRMDSHLVTVSEEPLPVAIRIKALKDPLSGCSGFRMTMTPRQ